MPRTKSSKEWLKEHFTDPYVKQSWKDGYRSRAAYKLIEMDTQHRLFKPGMLVIDLGAAPGSWSQVVSKKLGGKGRIIALDLLPIAPMEHVLTLQGDFSDEAVYAELKQLIGEARADVIVSDIAPNMSGQKAVDQMRMIVIGELVFEFAREKLKPHGTLLIKVFQGEGFDDYMKMLKPAFDKVRIIKPEASRNRSSEYYLLATGFKGSSVPAIS